MKCRCANCGWLEVNPSGAMFCGYSDERTWENESCLAWKDNEEPQTNADRIRQMTDEELADFMEDTATWGGCPNNGARDCTSDCGMCWLAWLKAAADKDSE